MCTFTGYCDRYRCPCPHLQRNQLTWLRTTERTRFCFYTDVHRLQYCTSFLSLFEAKLAQPLSNVIG